MLETYTQNHMQKGMSDKNKEQEELSQEGNTQDYNTPVQDQKEETPLVAKEEGEGKELDFYLEEEMDTEGEKLVDEQEEALHPKKEDKKFDEMRLEVDMGQSMLRIDKYLSLKIPNLSRSRIQSGIRNGDVIVNGLPVKTNYKVKGGDVVMVIMPPEKGVTEIVPQDIPIRIVHEDDQIIIVNKEAGMVVHPGHNNWSGTLVNALMHHVKHLPTAFNAEDKPGLVHRIDKDTSGLLVTVKTEQAMNHLAKQFFHHTIERTYYALVWGEPEEDQGTIDNYIGRSQNDRRVSVVYPNEDYGKRAITHYKVLKRMRYVSLVQCNLETGRTHQIRVHMKHLGHPLFGDVMYGGNKILKGTRTSKYKQFVENCLLLLPRQGLHAKSLGFEHPTTGEWMQFDSDLPEDMVKVIEKWEKYVKYV
ncbi:RluA family pseudouridine synthase [Algivirga pacifica]|uniref:RluA family pseudouridine synthase n=1 Tax=Algivirga pacifica TaxID=1162670 RepID=A0ABP9CW36_9BACT